MATGMIKAVKTNQWTDIPSAPIARLISLCMYCNPIDRKVNSVMWNLIQRFKEIAKFITLAQIAIFFIFNFLFEFVQTTISIAMIGITSNNINHILFCLFVIS